jgi:hypothetical protein
VAVLLGWCAWLVAATQEVELRAPLTTLVRCAGTVPTTGLVVRARVRVPVGAPADLGVGAFVADRHGRWFQRTLDRPLIVGVHDVAIALGPDEPVAAAAAGRFDAATASQAAQAGLFLWSAGDSRVTVVVEGLRTEALPLPVATPPHLTALTVPGLVAGVMHLHCGVRAELGVVPVPLPENPYDPARFALDAEFTHPAGHVMRVPGFAIAAMRLTDRGDREVAAPADDLRFAVRWRPPFPGTWTGRLTARWAGHEPLTCALPPIVVAGPAVDDVVRVDAHDPRFFAIDGRFFWPIGMNLHSTFDVRSRERLGTVLTPPRGTAAYRDRFRRLSAAGGNATEIWLSSWNLALEWNAAWPGYAGMGRYSQENAARLDAVLDAAHANGIRVNLVINNHGQASPEHDREWRDHPWNRANGGLLEDPYELFTDARSLTAQADLRRYLVARYGDHPAILGWKLWSEVNLTALGGGARRTARAGSSIAVTAMERRATSVRWHEQAAAHLAAIDPYRHPVTTHWSGDYRRPEAEVCALPGLGYLCIDAYHSGRAVYTGSTIVDLIWNGMQDPVRGLARHKKPLLVTEYGGSSGGSSDALLAAELASAPFAALVSGNAGMPFLWWFEWIDQADRWQPFTAIARFVAGEDLRGHDARAVVLSASSGAGPWWARAWVRPGRMLGYLADHRWTGDGVAGRWHVGVTTRIGAQVAPGPCRVEWWSATTGEHLGTVDTDHPGGALDLAVPEFLHHIAFKLSRRSDPAAMPR